MAFDYNLILTGYVGGVDFSAKTVYDYLSEHPEEITVLIDSLGGDIATALSIAAAFHDHGNVKVHLRGLVASAATVASLGAKTITMDKKAVYLVHKASYWVDILESMNADDFSRLMDDCNKYKGDLDKIDLMIASMYAERCKKKPEELLALMANERFLTADETLQWGFIDEVTENPEDKEPKISNAMADAMRILGMPVPESLSRRGARASIFDTIHDSMSLLFKKTKQKQTMNKVFKCICAVLGVETVAISDSVAEINEQQLDSIEKELENKNKKIEDLENEITRLKDQPGDTGSKVVDDVTKRKKHDVDDVVSNYISTTASALKLMGK